MDVLHRFQAGGGRVLNPPRRWKPASTSISPACGSSRPGCRSADRRLSGCRVGAGSVRRLGATSSSSRYSAPKAAAWCASRMRKSLAHLPHHRTNASGALPPAVCGAPRLGPACIRHRRPGAGGDAPACADDWRTNVAQGGRAEAVSLTAEEERLTLAAARAVGTVVAGVDLLPRPGGGYYVLEVNAVPGWRALGRATGTDVAGEIIRSLTPHEPCASF